jgi:hypothetical protein
MKEPIVYVCVLSSRAWLPSAATNCAKCGIFCFYTIKSVEYARQRWKGHELRFECESCSAGLMDKLTDRQIRQSQEAARAGLPDFMQPTMELIGPDWVREHFRKRRVQ